MGLGEARPVLSLLLSSCTYPVALVGGGEADGTGLISEAHDHGAATDRGLGHGGHEGRGHRQGREGGDDLHLGGTRGTEDGGSLQGEGGMKMGGREGRGGSERVARGPSTVLEGAGRRYALSPHPVDLSPFQPVQTPSSPCAGSPLPPLAPPLPKRPTLKRTAFSQAPGAPAGPAGVKDRPSTTPHTFVACPPTLPPLELRPSTPSPPSPRPASRCL